MLTTNPWAPSAVLPDRVRLGNRRCDAISAVHYQCTEDKVNPAFVLLLHHCCQSAKPLCPIIHSRHRGGLESRAPIVPSSCTYRTGQQTAYPKWTSLHRSALSPEGESYRVRRISYIGYTPCRSRATVTRGRSPVSNAGCSEPKMAGLRTLLANRLCLWVEPAYWALLLLGSRHDRLEWHLWHWKAPGHGRPSPLVW